MAKRGKRTGGLELARVFWAGYNEESASPVAWDQVDWLTKRRLLHGIDAIEWALKVEGVTCPICKGTGVLREKFPGKDPDDPYVDAVTGSCANCGGTGYVLPKEADPVKRTAS